MSVGALFARTTATMANVVPDDLQRDDYYPSRCGGFTLKPGRKFRTLPSYSAPQSEPEAPLCLHPVVRF
jgi:hypothetical protein